MNPLTWLRRLFARPAPDRTDNDDGDYSYSVALPLEAVRMVAVRPRAPEPEKPKPLSGSIEERLSRKGLRW